MASARAGERPVAELPPAPGSPERLRRAIARRKRRPTLDPDVILELEEEFNDLKGLDDDDAKVRSREIARALREQGPHIHCDRDEPDVDVVVPPGPDGKPVLVSGKPIVGPQRLALCQWREVERILDNARRQDAERIRDGGVLRELGTVGRDLQFRPAGS